ncbi:hypothetical protein B0H34DRAFT_796650 [Crassisporium funariophilum]|nr:hypothetical protein B0H34DRAFT_796650 [Crassisporium funariophilum]
MDVFLVVFGHLNVRDVLYVRQTSKAFCDITKTRSLWNKLIHDHVLRKNIPIPGLGGRQIDTLTSQELEQYLYRALNLRRNWTLPSPNVVRQTDTLTIQDSRVFALHFLPAAGARWLVSLSMSAGRLFTLQCWDIHASPPTCAAVREMRNFRGMAVNKVSSESGSIAILDPQLETLSFDPTSTDPSLGFLRIGGLHQDGTTSIQSFSNATLITRDINARLYLWDVGSPQSKLELRTSQPHSVLDVMLIDELALVMRSKSLELYALPLSTSFSGGSASLYPVMSYQWPWRVDNVVMTRQFRPLRTFRTNDTISILIRFGSLFPWSINLLHHYELHPNVLYASSSPLNEANLPYDFPPVLRETIASPVRLHATSDMAIGPYGTAIWTDSHTEDYFGHADRGQRLAGRFSPGRRFEDGENEEVELSDQIATATANSVYSFQEEDSWLRVALDETEGKVALGGDDGRISILEYI